ncbi:MAG: hypothetical protein KAW12_19010 [Candidatus Aminicenantes bacterium]|nr:hypothetical protein [Candidatus Aminicenantes bacterium]
MTAKKLLLLIAVVFTLSLLLQGEKRYPPIPLEELQDPKSPSYVPIPYPQTREEILVDLKYAIKRNFTPRKGVRSYGEISKGDRLLPELLKEDSALYVGKIAAAKNTTFHRAEKFINMDIHDSTGDVVCRMSLEDSGLWSGAGFGAKGLKINPIKTIDDVKDFFATHHDPTIAGLQIQSIEYECYVGSSVRYPMLRLNTENKTFYLDSRNTLFVLKKKEKYTSIKEFRMALFKKYTIQGCKREVDSILTDLIESEALFLKKIKN